MIFKPLIKNKIIPFRYLPIIKNHSFCTNKNLSINSTSNVENNNLLSSFDQGLTNLDFDQSVLKKLETLSYKNIIIFLLI